jgi:hypothetical protein
VSRTILPVIFFVCVACGVVYAQGQRFPTQAPPAGPAPRTIDGKADLSGVWLRPNVLDPGKPQMLPWASALTSERTKNNFQDSPSTRCLPLGVSFLGPILTKFVQTAAVLVILQEAPGGGAIQVFLDGRGHPKNLDPTWFGDSVGKWDGDTLIVDTTGFNEQGWLDPAGRPRTEKLHVIDRIRRIDFGHLEIETTIDDPGTFVRPWTSRRTSTLAPGEEVHEFICEDNQYVRPSGN